MNLIPAILVCLMLSGCAAKNVARAMYCERKTPDGKHCAAWAKHPYPCVSTPDGSCTAETK